MKITAEQLVAYGGPKLLGYWTFFTAPDAPTKIQGNVSSIKLPAAAGTLLASF